MEIINTSERAALAERLSADVDAGVLKRHKRNHSWRLGPSSMDTECDRKVWYGFRWVKVDERSPRMTRLLEHGKLMEARFEEQLRDAGCTLYTIDPQASPNAMNKQFRIRSVGGHVGAYLDGIVILPTGYPYTYPMPAEFKSGSTGKPFELTKSDVRLGKPEHFEQFSYYGWHYNRIYGDPTFRYSLYYAVNKNDDDTTIQIVENDFGRAALLEERMRDIILTPRPPTRRYENATDFHCKSMCRFKDICHSGAAYEVNCRSCDYASPLPNGEWNCNLKSAQIPREVVKVGCEQYHPVGR